ncbi:MAG: hypothetical protein MJZ34_07965 [Paludibacteraceae bacterium]|nr:hypothetical protein [Paludibacteraceae bacterium]
MSKNNPIYLKDIKSGKVKLAPMSYVSHIIYSYKMEYPSDCPMRWEKHTHKFDVDEVSLTFNQVMKDIDNALAEDPDCFIISFHPRNYFIVRDKIETDCCNFLNGTTNAYMYAENNNPNFNYLK